MEPRDKTREKQKTCLALSKKEERIWITASGKGIPEIVRPSKKGKKNPEA